MKAGRAGTVSHAVERHGTRTLFVALRTLDGTKISICEYRRPGQGNVSRLPLQPLLALTAHERQARPLTAHSDRQHEPGRLQPPRRSASSFVELTLPAVNCRLNGRVERRQQTDCGRSGLSVERQLDPKPAVRTRPSRQAYVPEDPKSTG